MNESEMIELSEKLLQHDKDYPECEAKGSDLLQAMLETEVVTFQEYIYVKNLIT